jgi:hypothetical protein
MKHHLRLASAIPAAVVDEEKAVMRTTRLLCDGRLV